MAMMSVCGEGQVVRSVRRCADNNCVHEDKRGKVDLSRTKVCRGGLGAGKTSYVR